MPYHHVQANAALAVVAARSFGVGPAAAVAAMAAVAEVDGRYRVLWGAGNQGRLFLAKNPAGWAALLDGLARSSRPIVVVINARVADGRDPSWLWDVPFERLAGRPVIAAGDRWRDLSVRLRYAEVRHTTAPDLDAALARARAGDADVAATYTAFRQVTGAGGRGRRSRERHAGVGRPPGDPGPRAPRHLRRLGQRRRAGQAARVARHPRRDDRRHRRRAPPSDADLYVLGGGEDGPQTLAVEEIRAGRGLAGVVDRGAVVFGVCAGLQLLGEVFPGRDGVPVAGLGILDLRTERGTVRSIGEVVAEVDPDLGIGRLTGFENHLGVTRVGPSATPLATVVAGRGNGADGVEGAHRGHVVGTYLHGPVLARNPALADLLLGWVVGPLAPLEIGEVDALRAERLVAGAEPARRTSWDWRSGFARMRRRR